MDPLIADLFDHIRSEHASTGYKSDMPTVARSLGLNFELGNTSVALPDGTVRVSRTVSVLQQRADAAHEISHALANAGGYTRAIEYYHASAPDLDAHIEELADHGADLLLMPDALVREIVRQQGYTGRSAWELSRFAGVDLPQAVRRLVFATEQRCAGFIAQGSYIQEAFTQNYYLPFWKGDRVPELHLYQEEGLSLFAVPERRGCVIGFIAFGP